VTDATSRRTLGAETPGLPPGAPPADEDVPAVAPTGGPIS